MKENWRESIKIQRERETKEMLEEIRKEKE